METLKKLDNKVAKIVFLDEDDNNFFKENCIHFTWWVRQKIAEERKKRRLR